MHEDLKGRDLTQLCDLLVEKTMQLLKVMEERSSPARIHEIKREVELIQSAIKEKKTNGHS
jgi:hypothetical protein